MKNLFVAVFAIITFTGFSQSSYDINFERSVTPSVLNAETDSLFSDKAEIRLFENNAASSIELKYYDYADTAFTEVHSSTITIISLSGSPCGSDYCAYKLNPSVVIIDLGSHSATGNKHKVYIKINGVAGKQDLIKEAEL